MYWSDFNGPEVDWVIERPNQLIPIEVKYTDRPHKEHIKHFNLFLEEYETADLGYVVCQVPRKIKMADKIYALPWQELPLIFS